MNVTQSFCGVVGGVVAGAATGGVGAGAAVAGAAVACGVDAAPGEVVAVFSLDRSAMLRDSSSVLAAVSLAWRAWAIFSSGFGLPGVWTAPLVSLS